jgi:hypothetical protein
LKIFGLPAAEFASLSAEFAQICRKPAGRSGKAAALNKQIEQDPFSRSNRDQFGMPFAYSITVIEKGAMNMLNGNLKSVLCVGLLLGLAVPLMKI